VSRKSFLIGLGTGIITGALLLQLMLIGREQEEKLSDRLPDTNASEVMYTQEELDKRLEEERQRIEAKSQADQQAQTKEGVVEETKQTPEENESQPEKQASPNEEEPANETGQTNDQPDRITQADQAGQGKGLEKETRPSDTTTKSNHQPTPPVNPKTPKSPQSPQGSGKPKSSQDSNKTVDIEQEQQESLEVSKVPAEKVIEHLKSGVK